MKKIKKENMCQSENLWMKYSSIILPIRWGLTFVAICSILQFFVVGGINLIRGYSIGTYLTHKILLAGVVVLIVLSFKYLKKPAIFLCYSLTGSFIIIYISLIGIHQGRYIEEAERYYNTGQYQKALLTYKKEAQTWYHLLRYNYNERIAMNMIAKTYCQLRDFDSARDTYNLITDRYAGEFYAGRAQERLVKLEEGLKIVTYYPDQVPETKGFPSDLYNIARTYQYDLNCHTKALEIYKKIVEMDIDEKGKKLARNQIEKLTELQ